MCCSCWSCVQLKIIITTCSVPCHYQYCKFRSPLLALSPAVSPSFANFPVLSESMWSMYSIAMLLWNNLRCFGVIYFPFQYGVVALFCVPRMKKPPDPNWSGELTLVEGIIDLINLPCNKHFPYQKFRRMKRKEIDVCEEIFAYNETVNNKMEKAKRTAL